MLETNNKVNLLSGTLLMGKEAVEQHKIRTFPPKKHLEGDQSIALNDKSKQEIFLLCKVQLFYFVDAPTASSADVLTELKSQENS